MISHADVGTSRPRAEVRERRAHQCARRPDTANFQGALDAGLGVPARRRLFQWTAGAVLVLAVGFPALASGILTLAGVSLRKEAARVGYGRAVIDAGTLTMSGFELARGVKTIDPRVRVALLSGWAIQQEGADARGAGVDFVLGRPCTIDALLGTIQAALRASPGAPAPEPIGTGPNESRSAS